MRENTGFRVLNLPASLVTVIPDDALSTHGSKREVDMLCDIVTGLPDAVLFVDRLQQSLAHAARRKQQVALFYLDIDCFRQIIEANGPTCGDAVLRELAGRLGRCALRQEDTVARLCGDQFVMVLGDVDTQGAKDVLDKIIAAMQQKFSVAGKELAVSVSIGASLFPHDGKEWSPMLRHASMLMRQAKLSGGNRYVYHGDGSGLREESMVGRQTSPQMSSALQKADNLRSGEVSTMTEVLVAAVS
jgi:diguanylate cyclase (GGDEF)-like protein